MFRRILVMLVVLALLVGSLPAIAESADLPDFFAPETFISQFNENVEAVAQYYYEDDVSKQEEIIQSLRLTYKKVEADKGLAYYQTSNGSMTCLAAYLNQAVAADMLDTPADAIVLSTDGSMLSTDALAVVWTSLVYMIYMDDTSLDVDALNAWLNETYPEDDVYPLKGYSLKLDIQDGDWTYMLLPDSLTSASADGAGADDSAPENAVFGYGGFSVEPLRYDTSAYDDGSTYLELYCRIINNTNQTLSLISDAVTVNGVTVNGGNTNVEPGTDTGPDSDEYFIFYPDGDHLSEGKKAILDPHELKMTWTLYDGSFNELTSKEIVLDFNDIPKAGE